MKLYLIDGYGFIFRAFHSLPPLTTQDGKPIGAVYGFINMLVKILAQHKAEMVAVVLDTGKKSFRHQIYDGYKANRPEAPTELISQFPIIREAINALNLVSIEREDYEADDVIATYAAEAKKKGYDVTIISSDKDLLQLMDLGATIFDPMKDKEITASDVETKHGVEPKYMVDLLALMGDSSDNVPGVPGIGAKTAAKLIQEFGDIENIYKNIDKIDKPRTAKLLLEGKEEAFLSKQLISLHKNVPVNYEIEELKVKEYDHEYLNNFLHKYGFKSLIHKLGVESDAVAAEPVNFIRLEKVSQYKAFKEQIRQHGEIALYLEEQEGGKVLTVSCHDQHYMLPIESEQKSLFSSGDPISDLAPFLASESIRKIVLDAKWWIKYLLGNYSIKFQAYEDISVLAYSIGTGRMQYDFKGLIKEYLDNVEEEENSATLLHLYKVIQQKLIRTHHVALYQTIDKPMSQILADMELKGVKLDRDFLKGLTREFSEKLSMVEQEIYKICGHEFNIGSPKQLGPVLFEELGLPGGKKSRKTKSYSTSSDTLETLALQGFEIAEKVQEWRKFSKLISTYTKALPEHISVATNRVHTTFSMQSTATGRLSSNNPNLQNIPIRTPEGHRIRQAFIAEEGYKIVAADYSQIELRLLAHIADIQSLQEALKSGVDIHTKTASTMFGIPVEEVDYATRRKAKAINFGIIYGISSFGLAKNLKIAREDAALYISNYFRQYPGIKEYMDKTVEFAKTHGYVETLFGRSCYIAGLHDKNFNIRSFAERAAINAPLQGTAADIMKKAMIKLPEAAKKYLVLQVHDELLFEIPESEAESLASQIKNTLENVVQLSIPITAAIAIGDSWKEH